MPVPTSGQTVSRPVQRSLLSEQIANDLRRDILTGTLTPGSRIAQQALCEQFGVSRMPVRDALRVLTHEGLLVTDSAQHSVVAPLSRSDLQDSFLIEGTLTGIAASRASKNAQPDDLSVLEELHHNMVQAAGEGNQDRMTELNWSFHRFINRLAKSRKLISAIRFASLDLPRTYLMELPEWNSRSNEQHEAILQAMRKRQHARVGALMVEHVVESGSGLIGLLEARGLALD